MLVCVACLKAMEFMTAGNFKLYTNLKFCVCSPLLNLRSPLGVRFALATTSEMLSFLYRVIDCFPLKLLLRIRKEFLLLFRTAKERKDKASCLGRQFPQTETTAFSGKGRL